MSNFNLMDCDLVKSQFVRLVCWSELVLWQSADGVESRSCFELRVEKETCVEVPACCNGLVPQVVGVDFGVWAFACFFGDERKVRTP